jgi:hypothetical protein
MRFADFSRCGSPGEHFLAGGWPGLYHMVERRMEFDKSPKKFFFFRGVPPNLVIR